MVAWGADGSLPVTGALALNNKFAFRLHSTHKDMRVRGEFPSFPWRFCFHPRIYVVNGLQAVYILYYCLVVS